MKILPTLAIFIAVCASWTYARAQNSSVSSPDMLIQTSCRICHSVRMIEQQRLGRDAWLAEVRKMKGWGAPIQDDQVAAVADYLAAHYGSNLPPMRPQVLSAAEAIAVIAPEPDELKAGSPARGSRLYADACASCHNDDARGRLGPDLVQRPILLRWRDWDDVIIRGRRSMPGFAGVLSQSEIADILAWVRSRRVTFGN